VARRGKHEKRAIAVAGAAVVVLAVAGWALWRAQPWSASMAPERAQPTGRKVLVVGLDAADWQIAGPLVDAGRMPHLAGLRSRGSWGNLRSMVPVLSPLLWTTVATGTTADRHGVIDFLVPDPATGRKSPVQSSARRVPALWDHFTAHGLSSDVVAWWATWPAEPIQGHVISDRVAYSLFGVAPPPAGSGLTWPREALDRIRPALVPDTAIAFDDVSRFIDVTRADFDAARARLASGDPEGQRHPVGHLIRILAATRTYHAIALSLIRSGQADFTAVYYQGIDEVCHRFIHFAPPALEGIDPEDVRRYGGAVERFYIWQDELLGELLAAADPGTVVIVLSDHGFTNGPDRPAGQTADIEGQPARWHRRHGILVTAGPGIRAGKIDTASLLDIAPTVLYLAGLPIPESMTGEVARQAIDPDAIASRPPIRVADGRLPPLRTGSVADVTEDPGAEEMMATLRSLGYIGGGDGAPSRRQADAAAPAGTAAATDGGRPMEVPDTLTAHANMAGILLAAGDLPGAEKEVMAAMRLAPRSLQARQLLFDLRMRQRRFPEALEAGEALLQSESALPGELFLARLAVAYRESGQMARGVDRLEKEVAQGRWQMGGALARLHKEAGRPREAEAAAREVLARHPLDESSMAVLVSLVQRDGGAGIASLEPMLSEALERNPRSLMHLNWMGLLRQEEGNTAAALLLLDQALEVNPDHPATLANLGAIHLKSGRADLALPVLVRAVDLNPTSVEARVNLGTSWARQERYRDAILQFETVWRQGYRHASIAGALARAWLGAGDRAAAAHWKQQAAEAPKAR
jgi:predicted AlkP superfamily phosphohydrolase/phosphomutase/tetratricopeptide (TPR) repeat protein